MGKSTIGNRWSSNHSNKHTHKKILLDLIQNLFYFIRPLFLMDKSEISNHWSSNHSNRYSHKSVFYCIAILFFIFNG